MRTLICGSIAYDTIMVFHDRFRNHILPDKLHILNVAFLVPDMRREFGGCAGNIAYSLKLLGGDPLIMATVGDDHAPYSERLDRLGLARTHVREVPGSFTAQAFITTDLDDNQITAFHPGAMGYSHLNRVHEAKDVKLGIVAPDGRDGAVTIHQDVAIYATLLDPGQRVEHRLRPGRYGWIQVVRGSVRANETTALAEADGAAVTDEALVSLQAHDAAEVLLFDLA